MARYRLRPINAYASLIKQKSLCVFSPTLNATPLWTFYAITMNWVRYINDMTKLVVANWTSRRICIFRVSRKEHPLF